jgi:hypothetical protein
MPYFQGSIPQAQKLPLKVFPAVFSRPFFPLTPFSLRARMKNGWSEMPILARMTGREQFLLHALQSTIRARSTGRKRIFCICYMLPEGSTDDEVRQFTPPFFPSPPDPGQHHCWMLRRQECWR